MFLVKFAYLLRKVLLSNVQIILNKFILKIAHQGYKAVTKKQKASWEFYTSNSTSSRLTADNLYQILSFFTFKWKKIKSLEILSQVMVFLESFTMNL